MVDVGYLVRRGLGALATGLIVLGSILFIGAGELAWVQAWVLLGLLVAMLCVNFLVLVRVNRELLEVRVRPERGARRWDKVVLGATTFLWLGSLVLAGLDRRWGWSAPFPILAAVVGACLFVAGDLLILWAMAVNRFFTRLVRIQQERGHSVVRAGPYRYVRHPGYIGWSLMCVSMPLVLGSWWGLAAAVASVGGIVVRTVFEDATLRRELPGYAEYAHQIRWRLLPYVW